jgi:ribosomal protein S18 acetylase RimI-like enzyme
MTDIVLRELRRGDGASVQGVARETWRYTYKEIFRADFIDQFIATNYSPEALENLVALIEAGAMFFCVAVIQGSIVGFSNIWDRGQGMELLRIYVLPAYIGKGVGRKLLVVGEEFVRARGSNRYFCLVHQRNQRALKFYLRNQFRHVKSEDRGDEMYLEKLLA